MCLMETQMISPFLIGNQAARLQAKVAEGRGW